MAAGQHARAGRDRAPHLIVEIREHGPRRQRADLGRRIERIADLERAHPLGEAALEDVRHRLGHDEALGGDARLPAVDDPRLDRRLDRRGACRRSASR